LRRALDEYTIAGVRTTIPFHQWLVRHPAFVAGDFSTDFIAEQWHPDKDSDDGATKVVPTTKDGDDTDIALSAEELAVLVAALVSEAADQAATRRRGAGAEEARSEGSRWRSYGRRSAMGKW
jgi:acetyl/propionyl-CoA carboxylase alpha subunit